MLRSGSAAACLAALLLLGSVTAASAESEPESTPQSMSEMWYVLRGRANMKIGNYKAAIEAFHEAVQLNPGNREAMRSLGIAYEKQGLTDKAIEQFDRYLARFDDDPEIAFKQAQYLSWDRYAYRRNDAIRYYRMGLARQDDLNRRHVLARLLAEDRGRLDEALEQYRILLDARPDDATWRAEYRDLLLWDPKHLAEAVKEYRRLASERPDDFAVQHELARLVARQKPRGDEPVSLYEDLVERRPGDTTVRLEYAKVLARHRKLRDQALGEYRLVLARSPAFETREEYADLLSGDEEDREAALEQYRLLLAERPDDAPLRIKYARLLGAERDDTQRAIVQYEIVLAREPWNAAAHEGLAASYAWLGDRDRALEHANLAMRYGDGAGDIASLRDNLLEGREPRIEPRVFGLVQRGRSKSELNGLGFGLRGRFDPSPFVTLRLDAGFQDYWRSGDNDAGGYGTVTTEFRIDPTQRIEAELSYRSFGPGSGRNVVGRIEYAREGDAFDLVVGFTRTPRFDSYTALVGDARTGFPIGSARDNRFYGRMEGERGRLSGSLEAYTGWVDSLSLGANPLVGLGAGLGFALHDSHRWELGTTLDAEIYHYRDDAFGIFPFVPGPLPGGYFSPQLFFEVIPGITSTIHWGKRSFLELEGGPALQLVDESTTDTSFKVGGRARVAYVLFVRESLFCSVNAAFVQISDAYTRLDFQTSLTFRF